MYEDFAPERDAELATEMEMDERLTDESQPILAAYYDNDER